jgi:hypothetical protein
LRRVSCLWFLGFLQKALQSFRSWIYYLIVNGAYALTTSPVYVGWFNKKVSLAITGITQEKLD